MDGHRTGRCEAPGNRTPLTGGLTSVVAAAEAALARRAYDGVVPALRRDRRALLLQPDVELDGDLVGVRLTRRTARPLPPGRGELVERGHVSLVQVAMSSIPGNSGRRSLYRA